VADKIILQRVDAEGQLLQATFLPEQGMNLASYRRGSIEVIAQSTRPLFEERMAGLGPLIGPHFYHRKDEEIPPVPHPEAFPHIAGVFAKGVREPFSHGIGRYVPWQVEATETKLVAVLSSDTIAGGVPLSALEGQAFTMTYVAELTPDGLHLQLEVFGQRPSLIGLHTYYDLPGAVGTVEAAVQPIYNDGGLFKPIPTSWNYQDHRLIYDVSQLADYGFIYHPDPLVGSVLLTTATYRLRLTSRSPTEQHAFQLYRPADAQYVCVEPLAARNPRQLTSPRGHLDLLIAIEPPGT